MSRTASPLTGLLVRLRAGDGAAREQVIRLALGRLELMTRAMFRQFPRLRSTEETWDVLNSALIRLDRALRAGVPSTSAGLYALAAEQIRRELLDLCRYYSRSIRRPSDAPPAAAREERPDPEADPQAIERWAAFHAAVETLPESVRTVFDHVFYRGLKKIEVAKLLRVDVQTVYRRWQVAVESLNEALGGDLPSW